MPQTFRQPLTSLMRGARPEAEYFGRHAERARLQRFARDVARGLSGAIAVAGPPGSGKSELLRQWLTAGASEAGELIAVHVDLGDMPGAAEGSAAVSVSVLRSLLIQILTAQGKLESRLGTASAESEAGRLISHCHAAGLGELTRLLTPQGSARMNAAAWRAVLEILSGAEFPPAILVLERPAGQNAAASELLLQDLIAAGFPVVFESHTPQPPHALTLAGELEELRLNPLTLDEARALADCLRHQRGWTLPRELVLPILERLGPWPGWVRSWAALVDSSLPIPPQRQTEEAYLRWLTDSAWAHRLRAEFDQAVPGAARDRALDLIYRLPRQGEASGLGEIAAALGLDEPQTEKMLEGLARLGLARRQGARWSAAPTPALADWIELQYAITHQAADPAGARLDLLSRRLKEASAREQTGAGCGFAAMLSATLQSFNRQSVPEVLFRFHDYFEALGCLPEGERRTAMQASRARITLPEVLGVATSQARGEEDRLAVYYARAFRGGAYQRSNEEVWLIADLTGTGALTSPEVEQALRQFERIERRMGAAHYVRWLAIAENASREALGLLGRERVYCSNLEQFQWLREQLAHPEAFAPRAEATASNVVSTHEFIAPEPTVVATYDHDLPATAGDAVTRKDLPARDGSELTAARAAERLALDAGFDAAAAGKIKTAVLEGTLNAVEHSPNQEKRVLIEFRMREERFEIRIENEGRQFDPLAVAEPDPKVKLTAANKRGWGISLMRKFMDEVGYEPSPRGTVLRLVKNRPVARTESALAAVPRERKAEI